jgi:hypothetical protein
MKDSSNRSVRVEMEIDPEDGAQVLQALMIIETRLLRSVRDEYLRCAIEGDWAPLAKHIRNGGRVTPQMRPLLADILDGKLTRPIGKISKSETRARNWELAGFIWEARERGEKNIAEKAEKKFGRTWRQLQKILASERKKTDDLEGRVSRAVQSMSLLRALVEQRNELCGRGVTSYTLNDMALTPHTLT